MTVCSGRVGLTYESLVKIVNEKIYFIWKLLLKESQRRRLIPLADFICWLMVVNSRIWLHRLMNRIQAAENLGEGIWITII